MPELIESPLSHSILKRAKEKPIVDLLIQYPDGDQATKEKIKKDLMSVLGNDSQEAEEFLAAAND